MTVADSIPAALAGLVRTDEPIGALTTYRVGGRARWFATVTRPEQLVPLADFVAAADLDVLVVGRGSNLLVADSGFDGLAVQLGDGFTDIDIDGTHVTAGAAALLPVVARTTVAAGLTGFEWAVGVPGSVGGAVRMNAGGHGSDLAAVLDSIRVFDLATGEDGPMVASDLGLGYRRSTIGPTHVVLGAVLALAEGDPAAGEAELQEIVRWRRANQPGGPNAGSVFTNPEGDSAGRLIDAAGLKGHRLGTAEVSPKHANFIQADSGGRAADVLALMRHIQAVVSERFGVDLHPETRIVGFGPEDDQR